MTKLDPKGDEFQGEIQRLLDQYAITGVVLIGFEDVDSETARAIIQVHGEIAPPVLLGAAKDLMKQAFEKLSPLDQLAYTVEQFELTFPAKPKGTVQ